MFALFDVSRPAFAIIVLIASILGYLWLGSLFRAEIPLKSAR